MALFFNNDATANVELADETPFDLSAEISLSVWARAIGWTITWETIISKGDNAWRLGRNNNTAGLHWATSATSPPFLNWAGTFDDDEWHHVVCTFLSGTPGRKYIILDGNIVASDLTITGAVSQTDNPVQIGNNWQQGDRGLDGYVDDARIYDRELSFAEAHAIYVTKGTDNITEGLISRFMFDEGAPGQTPSGAGVIKDIDGAHNGTPSGTVTWNESSFYPVRRML